MQRLILPSFSLDINVSLGTSEYGGVNTAGALGVSPADSHTFAVSIGNSENCCGGGGPLEFFTDTTLLSNSISYPAISAFQFASATTLYGYSDDTLSQVTVNSSGGTLTTQWNDLLTGSGGIQYDAGLIYGSGGQVMNPTTGELVGSYDVGESCCSSSNDLLAESTIGRTFFAGVSPFFSSLGITSYNLSEFTPIAVINLSQLGGSVAPTFISWGTNGLAFVPRDRLLREPAFAGRAGSERDDGATAWPRQALTSRWLYGISKPGQLSGRALLFPWVILATLTAPSSHRRHWG